MRGGPGRVLPSVIVGGLLVGGLALGTGVAAAAASTCTDGTNSYDISGSKAVEADAAGKCQLTSGAVGTVLAVALKTLPKVPADTSATTNDTNSSDSAPVAIIPAPSSSTKPSPRPRHDHGAGSLGTTPSTGQTGTRNTPAPAVLAPAALAPAGAVARPAALPGLPLAPGLPLPGAAGVFPPFALAGGSLPGGLSSGLFGADVGNPALLAGTPLGAAATSLFAPQADSAVTTVSHSEALASGAPGGVGTPTAIAAVALACVVGILVRSRVLRRIAGRERMAAVLVDDPAVAEQTPADAAADDDPVAADAPLLAA